LPGIEEIIRVIRQYFHSDIEKWASYSGDRNKIHFDRELAVKYGLKDVIVQGMLILLDAKMMMSSCIKEGSSINFYIKKPVSICTDIEFSIKDGDKKKVLTVAEADNAKEVCVTATVLSQHSIDFTPESNQIRVSSEFIQSHIDLLKSYYPDIESNWLLMDTLLFCICFNQQKDDYFYRQSLKIPQSNRYDDITTYHVAQNIFISERLLTCGDINFSEISYAIEEKDVYINDDSAYSTFNITAIENSKVIYQSSIGCMTKASNI
jgi:hypothetical protein